MEGQDGDGVVVSAAFIVWRFRGKRSDCNVGRYDYLRTFAGGTWAIRSKRATRDLATLEDAASVSVIL
ncbi:MAG: Aromatic-ring-hydroxylating dioxygenase subunit beta [Candidatus Eremiobacteraeota bacterium]|nr:Aromatic-ring-hydroxylating dioxygenase subunit beta [Candidatus Eremiobacteraeota bacterium]